MFKLLAKSFRLTLENCTLLFLTYAVTFVFGSVVMSFFCKILITEVGGSTALDQLIADFDKFPAAKQLTGYEATIGHGETVFMPSLWWHHIRYIDGGFSLALRANDSMFTFVKGGYNLARHQIVDRGMTKLLGEKWKSWNEEKAAKRALEVVV